MVNIIWDLHNNDDEADPWEARNFDDTSFAHLDVMENQIVSCYFLSKKYPDVVVITLFTRRRLWD